MNPCVNCGKDLTYVIWRDDLCRKEPDTELHRSPVSIGKLHHVLDTTEV